MSARSGTPRFSTRARFVPAVADHEVHTRDDAPRALAQTGAATRDAPTRAMSRCLAPGHGPRGEVPARPRSLKPARATRDAPTRAMSRCLAPGHGPKREGAP